MIVKRLAAGSVLGFVAVGLSGCIGGSDGGPQSSEECAPADEAMATATERLDETSGVEFSLSTDDEIDGTGLVTADAIVVRPGSFKGSFTVQTALGNGSGEAVGVDDAVWVKAPPLFTQWTEVDPAQFNLPDITGLLDDDGLSTLLVGAEGLGEGETQRDENDQGTTYCTYRGTVAAEQVGAVIPSAAGEDFTAEYAVDADGALRKATLTGDVYDTGSELTYVIDIGEYDVEADIQPPA